MIRNRLGKTDDGQTIRNRLGKINDGSANRLGKMIDDRWAIRNHLGKMDDGQTIRKPLRKDRRWTGHSQSLRKEG